MGAGIRNVVLLLPNDNHLGVEVIGVQIPDLHSEDRSNQGNDVHGRLIGCGHLELNSFKVRIGDEFHDSAYENQISSPTSLEFCGSPDHSDGVPGFTPLVSGDNDLPHASSIVSGLAKEVEASTQASNVFPEVLKLFYLVRTQVGLHQMIPFVLFVSQCSQVDLITLGGFDLQTDLVYPPHSGVEIFH